MNADVEMKAAYYKEFGLADKIIIGERPIPVPKPDDIKIKVIASSVNPIDWKLRKGLLKFFMRKQLPFITGADFCGVVEEIGKEVREFKVGDKVLGQTPSFKGGACAEYCVVKEKNIVLKPANMTDEEGAGLSLAGQTSYQALIEQAKLKKNQHILIVGASGGIGQMALQIAHSIGAKITAVSSKKNHEFVKSLGADKVIDYKLCDFRKEKIKVDVIYDCVGQDTPYTCRDILKKKGCILSPAPSAKTLLPLLFAKLLSVINFSPSVYLVLLKTNQERLKALVSLVTQDKLKVTVDKVFPLSNTKEAHLYSESQRAKGKIIISL